MCLIFLYTSFQGEGEKSYSNEPCCKGYLPISKSTSILLPAPFSPTIATCSPFLSSKETGSAILTSGMRGITSVSWIVQGLSTIDENLPLFLTIAFILLILKNYQSTFGGNRQGRTIEEAQTTLVYPAILHNCHIATNRHLDSGNFTAGIQYYDDIVPDITTSVVL